MHLQTADQMAILVVCFGFFIAIAGHFLHLPVWVSVFVVFSLLWRIAQSANYVPQIPRWLIVPFVLFGGIAVFATFWTITGRNAGLALLSVMAAFKLLESKTHRDALIVVFLSYFLVVTHFLFSQSMFVAIYMVFTVLFLTAALISLNERDQKLTWLIRFKISGSIIGYALPLMIILFILVPRVPGPLWGLTSEQRGGVTGLSDSMSPGKISNLIQDNSIAFRVSFKGAIPPQRELYWRGPVMSRFNGETWFQQTRKPPSLVEFEASGIAYEYTITMEPNGKQWLLPLDLPTHTIISSTMSRDFELKSIKVINDLKKYTLTSMTKAKHGLTDDFKYLIQNTEYPDTINPKTIAFGQQLRQRFDNDQELIDFVLARFSTEPYFYTLSPPLLNSDPIDDFLFTSKRGFCEHYAGSFALLMRAAEIPTRIVTGYQGGELNEEGNYLIVRQSDAHAWTEVWLDDIGWKRIDPTAAVSPDRIEKSLDAALDGTASFRFQQKNAFIGKLLFNWDNMQHQWNNWVLNYNQTKQSSFLKNLGLGIKSAADMVIALVVLMVLFTLSYALFSWYRNRPKNLIYYEQLFQQLLHKTRKAGVPIKLSESPSAYAIRLKKEQPSIPHGVLIAINLYVKVKYSALADESLIKQLKHQVSKVTVSLINKSIKQ